jgi:dihydrofolate synthase/folylpolyglutamate synthase
VKPQTLSAWLAHLERLHPKTIELGLERVNTVRERLGLSLSFPIITVAGTNGKGSTCAMLEAILAAAGYKVGCYTSPHLLRYNERVRINRADASDDELCRAFAAVDEARGDIPLTYFEFGTLAAVWQFAHAGIEAAVLEVGLGGRLDAVNAFDADCAVITSVDIDHTDYLGETREAIGFEKAGVFRRARPAVCADPAPPHTVADRAETVGAALHLIGRDFGFIPEKGQWTFWSGTRRLVLPWPALRGAYQLANASAAIEALQQLKNRLPVTPDNIRAGLLETAVPGRFQVLPGWPAVILDVAHNPHAARALAENLRAMPCSGTTIAVFAMLSDKDSGGVVQALKDEIGLWLLAGIGHERGASARQLLDALQAEGLDGKAALFPDIGAAYRHACHIATENDRIAVFGSFHTVAEAMQQDNRRYAKSAQHL